MFRGLLLVVAFILFSSSTWAGYRAFFSPADDLDQIVRTELSQAKTSIDIAIYTFRSKPVRDTLLQKLKDGVKVRMLVRRGQLKKIMYLVQPLIKAGAKMRYVSKTNHHKFAIIDGATLLNSSGNFNNSRLQKTYDENLVVCNSCLKMRGLFQQEFDYLFKFSNKLAKINDVIANGAPFSPRALQKGLQAVFTSFNFSPFFNKRTKKLSFKKVAGSSVVSDRLVSEIDSAVHSIKVATGHFRSYRLYSALKRAHQRGVKVQMIVDNQEYISSYWQTVENDKISQCLKSSKTKTMEICTRSGVHFARKAHAAGIDVKVKYYALLWSFPTAPQMHHKYMIVDDKKLITGSYNWSNNAEYNTFENIAIFKSKIIVSNFIANFEKIRKYGVGEFTKYRHRLISEMSKLPIRFSPKSLTFGQIDSLRKIACDRCPSVFCKSTLPPASTGKKVPSLCQVK